MLCVAKSVVIWVYKTQEIYDSCTPSTIIADSINRKYNFQVHDCSLGRSMEAGWQEMKDVFSTASGKLEYRSMGHFFVLSRWCAMN